jgi:hydroxymethylpyrimidine pyrophosphatase-like HAD family hydrolase
MAVKLVALDIDGTIVAGRGDHDGYPSDAVCEAVAALMAAGVEVVLASGRMFPGTKKIADYLGLASPVICQQGCSVHTLDGRMTHQFAIESHLADAIVAFGREGGWPVEWFNPLRYLVSAPNPASNDYGLVSGVPVEVVAYPERSGVTPTGVGIISDTEAAPRIHRDLVHRHGDHVHLLDFPSVTVAVHPDANKGHALSLVCDDLGIGRHEVVAVGDSVNDAAMLAWVGRGIALAHSDRYALDAADEVLPEDGPDTVARLLRSLVPKRPLH